MSHAWQELLINLHNMVEKALNQISRRKISYLIEEVLNQVSNSDIVVMSMYMKSFPEKSESSESIIAVPYCLPSFLTHQTFNIMQYMYIY